MTTPPRVPKRLLEDLVHYLAGRGKRPRRAEVVPLTAPCPLCARNAPTGPEARPPCYGCRGTGRVTPSRLVYLRNAFARWVQ